MNSVVNITPEIWLAQNNVPSVNFPLRQDNPGVISMTADAEIKMCLSCSVEYDGLFNYANDRLWAYVNIDDQRYKVGEYVITSSKKISSGLSSYYDLEALDLTYLARKKKIEERLNLTAGQKYTDIINSLLITTGITFFNVQPSSETLSTDRDGWDLGTDILSIINELLSEINYNSLWMDLDGVVRASAYQEPSVHNATKVYVNDEYSELVPGAEIKVDAFDHPNVFYYTCAQTDSEPINVVSINDDPANVFSIVHQGRNPVYYNVESTPNRDALQRTADIAKLNSMLSTDEIKFSTAINPTHYSFEIINLKKKELTGIVEETFWEIKLNAKQPMVHKGRVMISI